MTNIREALEPLPCPFCGGTKLTEHINVVACDKCDASGPDAGDGPAIEAWNKRAALSTPAAKREEGEGLVDEIACFIHGAGDETITWADTLRLAKKGDTYPQERLYWKALSIRDKCLQQARVILSHLSAAPSDEVVRAVRVALEQFVTFCTYPVAKEINPRGYGWRDEGALDYARECALQALSASPQAAPGVSEHAALKLRIHEMRVTMSSIETLADEAKPERKTLMAVRDAAKRALDRDADKAASALSRQQPATESSASTPGPANRNAMRDERSGTSEADSQLTDSEVEEKIRLAKWRSIRSAPKDRAIDLWFSEVGIGYRPDCRWSSTMKTFVWHGSIPNDGEWAICSMPNIKPSHWSEPLHLPALIRTTASDAEARLRWIIPKHLTRLIIAARVVAFEDQGPVAIKELDEASEAFADIVPWENEPGTRPVAHGNQGEHVEAVKPSPSPQTEE